MKAKRKPALNRNKSGKFKPGCSGNPQGRKPGVPDKRVELRALLEPSKDALIAKAVALALRGNVRALQLCLERLVPVLRATSPPVHIAIPTGTLGIQAEEIFKATVSGKLSTDDAKQLLELLQGRLRIAEYETLEQRISELEQNLEEKGGKKWA
jgi:Family of unknown function (DUF5681)